jgi:hypothetical protein
MSTDSLLPTVLLIGSAVLLVLAQDHVFRRSSSSQDLGRQLPPLPITTRTLISILCACLCGLGAMWLIPWTAVLPANGGRGLIPGLAIVIPLAAASIYAAAIGR